MTGRVITSQGNDRTELFIREASSAGIPLRLLLACAFSESGMDEKAERYGTHTQEAKAALANDDRGRLAVYITAAGNDISFGLGQRIVRYHWYGDKSSSVDNVLAVRAEVFRNPERDVHEMASWLANHYDRSELAARADPANYQQRVGGDIELGALIIYNAGHWPLADDSYWVTHGANLNNYRRGIAYADELIAEGEPVEPVEPTEDGGPMDIAQKAAEMTFDANGELIDRLGNGGLAYSELLEWETSGGKMAFRQFWLAHMLQYPVPTEENPDATDVTVVPEGTLTDEQLNQFRFGLA